MRSQRSGLGQRITRQQPASRNYAGHSAGLHPEEDDDLEEDEEYYVTRPRTSARRYDLVPEQVIRQGNRQYTIHHGAPPPRRQHQYIEDEEQGGGKGTRRRFHPLVWFGIALFIMIVGFLLWGMYGSKNKTTGSLGKLEPTRRTPLSGIVTVQRTQATSLPSTSEGRSLSSNFREAMRPEQEATRSRPCRAMTAILQ